MPTLHPRLARAPHALLGAALALLLVLVAPARAQTSDADPPARAARIVETIGRVWIAAADSGEWISATRNRPLTSGDRIASEAGARVELSLGSTVLRLDASSELEIVTLDDSRFAVELHDGSLAARLAQPEALAEFEVLTGEGRFRAQRVGRYRFDRDAQSSWLGVYSGAAVFERDATALVVHQGQRAEFWLDAAGAAQYSLGEPPRDAFAAWSEERDRSLDRIAAMPYVAPEMTGAEDLDRYGNWEQNAEYGPLWIPRGVGADWAPYSTGHWAWIRPWGWTWVDDAPWGFAPFHYGRWVYHRNTWCWAPGRYSRRPVFAPALVAWVGGRPGGGHGRPIGWFPLAPREAYVPGYRASPRYVRELNAEHWRGGHAADADGRERRDFFNRRFPHAVTVVPESVVANREAVRPSAIRFRDSAVAREFMAQPQRTTVLLAPPITAPARRTDGDLRRPPGLARIDAERRGPRFGAERPGEAGPAAVGERGTVRSGAAGEARDRSGSSSRGVDAVDPSAPDGGRRGRERDSRGDRLGGTSPNPGEPPVGRGGFVTSTPAATPTTPGFAASTRSAPPPAPLPVSPGLTTTAPGVAAPNPGERQGRGRPTGIEGSFGAAPGWRDAPRGPTGSTNGSAAAAAVVPTAPATAPPFRNSEPRSWRERGPGERPGAGEGGFPGAGMRGEGPRGERERGPREGPRWGMRTPDHPVAATGGAPAAVQPMAPVAPMRPPAPPPIAPIAPMAPPAPRAAEAARTFTPMQPVAPMQPGRVGPPEGRPAPDFAQPGGPDRRGGFERRGGAGERRER